MKKVKYVLTKRIVGKTNQEPGDVIEITTTQAQHPFYRNRVRPQDTIKTADVKQEDEGVKGGKKDDDAKAGAWDKPTAGK